MLHTTFGLFFCWNILVSARYEVGNHFSVKKYHKCFQTPASDRVNCTTNLRTWGLFINHHRRGKGGEKPKDDKWWHDDKEILQRYITLALNHLYPHCKTENMFRFTKRKNSDIQGGWTGSSRLSRDCQEIFQLGFGVKTWRPIKDWRHGRPDCHSFSFCFSHNRDLPKSSVAGFSRNISFSHDFMFLDSR